MPANVPVYTAAKQSSQSIDPTVDKRLEDLRSSMESVGSSMQSFVVWKWLKLYSDKPNGSDTDDPVTAKKEAKTLNGFSHSEFVNAFDRDKGKAEQSSLNKLYIDAAQPNDDSKVASYRDAQFFKVQIDLMAGLERDLRMRYRSRVRMLAHGVGRVQSHGLKIGPITNGIRNFLKLLADRK